MRSSIFDFFLITGEKRKRKEGYDWGEQLEVERSQWKEGEGGEDEDDVDQGKRGATWKMLKNQGLKAHKKRVDRNPRVKKRRQYEKAKKNRKGAVREMRSEQGSYKGETTGIRTTISRSRRLG